MSTTDEHKTIDITMEVDPELTYLPWKVSVENFAASKAIVIAPSGLLTDILTDIQWDALPLNRVVSPGGTVTIMPRPTLPTHIPITMGMTNSAISVAKYENERHVIWHTAQANFKSSLIRSLGPVLEGTIGPPPDGFKTISARCLSHEWKRSWLLHWTMSRTWRGMSPHKSVTC